MKASALLKTKLKEMLFGDSTIQDFVAVGIDDAIRERVYLQVADRLVDVSGRQWLLSLDPRVLGICMERRALQDLLGKHRTYRMYFVATPPEDEKDVPRQALAVLHLESHSSLEEGDHTLLLSTVTASDVRLLDPARLRLIYWRFYRKPGVSLERLKAVAAAYSYPRRVRIISFKENSDYDYIFPMDLLADIQQAGLYLLGLRHSNRVLARISSAKKIVVSEVPAHYKPIIYKLGRNHSATPPALAEMAFATLPSKEFGFHIPEWAESYKEIRIRRTLDLGSHMLLLGECATEVQRAPATPRLHHIHFLHSLYLKKRGLSYSIV
jgi:hypothetical protein